MSTETPQKDTTTKVKPKRDRSPNFPFINLKTAIERARQLYERAQTHLVPLAFVAETWSYKEKSSSFIMTIGALNSFGLICIEGNSEKRKIAVSKNAERIIGNAPDANELLVDAAFKPRLFREMWDKYKGQFPNDEVLRQHLQWGEDVHFPKKAIDAFISNLRETIEFAKAGEPDIISPDEESLDPAIGKPDVQGKNAGVPAKLTHPEGKMKNFTFPLLSGEVATLQVPHPMSKEDFDVMMGFINAFKKALVGPDKGVEEGGSQE